MDDLRFGTRDKRGNWKPNEPLEVAPFWYWPINIGKLARFAIGYIWPWNAFHMGTALLYFTYVIPDVETMKTLDWDWALWLYAVQRLR